MKFKDVIDQFESGATIECQISPATIGRFRLKKNHMERQLIGTGISNRWHTPETPDPLVWILSQDWCIFQETVTPIAASEALLSGKTIRVQELDAMYRYQLLDGKILVEKISSTGNTSIVFNDGDFPINLKYSYWIQES